MCLTPGANCFKVTSPVQQSEAAFQAASETRSTSRQLAADARLHGADRCHGCHQGTNCSRYGQAQVPFPHGHQVCTHLRRILSQRYIIIVMSLLVVNLENIEL